jgi:hypothetical protein
VREGPSPQQLAAIVAAVELVWPRSPAAPSDPQAVLNPWRFSGRWWSRPQTARRERPWLPLPS